MKYVIYTDGACSGNPGPGGWGAVILDAKNNETNILLMKHPSIKIADLIQYVYLH